MNKKTPIIIVLIIMAMAIAALAVLVARERLDLAHLPGHPLDPTRTPGVNLPCP